ncbi:hypothetical protein N4T21_00160 [Lacticaseibacillus paracasei]|uniref:hypothetical protein n=1 Tax=Lacticaseibacillus paracasei TaxID=1597 RepID=UPI0021AFD69F|nr:hypothetical protein [Lacticaseibacillus paracasei]UWY24616.1 hypothetical protein N4T21_00160 [Lacticaseibacillus paracasei]
MPKNKKRSVMISLVLTNIIALLLISLWGGYYDFAPFLVGVVSLKHALSDFLRTEIVIGGGFLILFNGYVLIWNLFLKKKSSSQRIPKKGKRQK